MNPKSQKWIVAGEILSADPAAKVMCPACGADFLRVEDHRHGRSATPVDRYMICDSCGAHQVLTRVRA